MEKVEVVKAYLEDGYSGIYVNGKLRREAQNNGTSEILEILSKENKPVGSYNEEEVYYHWFCNRPDGFPENIEDVAFARDMPRRYQVGNINKDYLTHLAKTIELEEKLIVEVREEWFKIIQAYVNGLDTPTDHISVVKY